MSINPSSPSQQYPLWNFLISWKHENYNVIACLSANFIGNVDNLFMQHCYLECSFYKLSQIKLPTSRKHKKFFNTSLLGEVSNNDSLWFSFLFWVPRGRGLRMNIFIRNIYMFPFLLPFIVIKLQYTLLMCLHTSLILTPQTYFWLGIPLFLSLSNHITLITNISGNAKTS